MKKICLNLCFQNYFVVGAQGQGGGLALLWKNDVQIQLLCMSKFNEILHTEENIWGVARPWRLIEEFRTTIQITGLFDLGFQGHMHTWKRGHNSGNPIYEKLDKALVNNNWCILSQVKGLAPVLCPN